MTKLLAAALMVAMTSPSKASDLSPRRSYAVLPFDNVAVAGCDSVTITPGMRFAVTAQGDPRTLATVTVSASGSTLHIGRLPHNCMGGEPRASVSISLPELQRVTLDGSGDVTVAPFGSSRFEGSVSGTGGLDLRELQAKQTRLAVSGTGAIRASGRVTDLAIDSSGTGNVDATLLDTSILHVQSSGTGSIRARVDGPARISASGTGSVTVVGRPTCTVTKNGLAHVTCG